MHVGLEEVRSHLITLYRGGKLKSKYRCIDRALAQSIANVTNDTNGIDATSVNRVISASKATNTILLTDRQTDGRTDRRTETDRQADRQTDRQTDRGRQRQI